MNPEEQLEKELKKLAEAGIDTSKIDMAHQFKEPIRRKSACDVYRNNKIFLLNLQNFYQYDSTKVKIPEKFGAEYLEDAEKKFKEMNGGLPFGWYSKLRKIFDSFKDVFIEKGNTT